MSLKSIALVIGDVMLDRRTEGEMTTISPEAPVPVIRQTSLTETLGGAGNVARNIVSLGHDALLIGLVGADEAGRRITQLAQETGIMACLPTWERPTIVKHRVTCGGKIVARIDTEDTVTPGVNFSGPCAGLCGLSPELIAEIKVIVIADYGKGTMTPELMGVVRQFAVTYGIPIFVDARPQTMNLYYDVTLLKPNLREALSMVSDSIHPGLATGFDSKSYCGVACHEVRNKYRTRLVVVTNGDQGCCYTDPDDGFIVHDLPASGLASGEHVKDICGAGDTTMAALAVGLLEGRPLSAAVQFAMDAAGYVVRFYGVQAAGRDEVDQFTYQRGGWSSKLMTHDGVLAFIARHRRLQPNAQIVLTNGCFDGFHAGHLETLRFAARQGTVVIVAYNDDQSLQRSKGPLHPQVPDSYRASHLALQECVDAVVRFDGDAAQLVRQLKPDVLVKGADTPLGQIVGADFMAQHGGRVERCPLDNFTITLDRSRTKTDGTDPSIVPV